MRVVLRDVEVHGARRDVVLADDLITDVTPAGEAAVPHVSEEIDGHGGAVIPGLHDHHLHLLAIAAARESVNCSEGLHALAEAPLGEGWLRGVGATDSVDRRTLDRLVPHRPVRVQHRTGGLWMLNSAALRAVSHVLDDTGDVERDETGRPTGRLWRYDTRLRLALDAVLPDLAPVAERLHRLGVTSVTDATPDLDPIAVAALTALPLRTSLLGDPASTAPWKILLRDHDLPALDDLATTIADQHARGRPVAVHCVTRESLVLTLVALAETGRVPGDRIEHASVVPPELRSDLGGLTVVTQPAFVTARAENYRDHVDTDDRPYLYPWASLTGAGVAVLPSTDAPHGPDDPWQVIRSARDRDLAPEERVDAVTALDGFLRDAHGRRRHVAAGQPAAVCLMHSGIHDVLAEPGADQVRRAIVTGDLGAR